MPSFTVSLILQPPALSLETNTEVTKTAIHRLAAGGWLQKGAHRLPMLKCSIP